MNARLAILGLLKEKPYHGYDIKRVMKERYMDEWANIAFGSIYFALGQLAEEGLIASQGTERDGHRPSRTVYCITETGRLEFARLLRESWQEVVLPPDPIRLCLVFIRELSPQEIISYLKRRAELLAERIEHIKAIHQRVATEGVPLVITYLPIHDVRLSQVELQWTKELLADIESGRINWQPADSDAQLVLQEALAGSRSV